MLTPPSELVGALSTWEKTPLALVGRSCWGGAVQGRQARFLLQLLLSNWLARGALAEITEMTVEDALLPNTGCVQARLKARSAFFSPSPPPTRDGPAPLRSPLGCLQCWDFERRRSSYQARSGRREMPLPGWKRDAGTRPQPVATRERTYFAGRRLHRAGHLDVPRPHAPRGRSKSGTAARSLDWLHPGARVTRLLRPRSGTFPWRRSRGCSPVPRSPPGRESSESAVVSSPGARVHDRAQSCSSCGKSAQAACQTGLYPSIRELGSRCCCFASPREAAKGYGLGRCFWD